MIEFVCKLCNEPKHEEDPWCLNGRRPLCEGCATILGSENGSEGLLRRFSEVSGSDPEVVRRGLVRLMALGLVRVYTGDCPTCKAAGVVYQPLGDLLMDSHPSKRLGGCAVCWAGWTDQWIESS